MSHNPQTWTDAFFLDHLGLTQRKTFGCPSYYAGPKSFAFISDGKLGFKYDPDKIVALVKKNPKLYSHFNPGDGIMKNWLLITPDADGGYDKELPLLNEAWETFMSAQ